MGAFSLIVVINLLNRDYGMSVRFLRNDFAAKAFSKKFFFFSGDIQQESESLFARSLNLTSVNRRLCSLNNVLTDLNSHLDNTVVNVLIPSRSEEGLNFFDPFLSFDTRSRPQFEINNNSLELLTEMCADIDDDNASLVLTGFSKGCCLLNQLLLSLTQKAKRKTLPSIEKLIFLDSGHNGDHLFYPVHDNCVEFIKSTGSNIHRLIHILMF